MAPVILVFSGGMDSTVLLADLQAQGKEVRALSFAYGSRHNGRELTMAAVCCREKGVEQQVIELPFIAELFASSLLPGGEEIPDGSYRQANMRSTVVPFRNGIMLAVAAGYAESEGVAEVYLASHAGDHFIYPDCRPEFNRAFADAVARGTEARVRLLFPYARLDKRKIGDLGRRLGGDFTRTWTCYKGGAYHCGRCGACDERQYGLRHREGLDPTTYLKG